MATQRPDVVPLWPDGSPNNPAAGGRPHLEVYLPSEPAAGLRGAVIVCPGGAYAHHAPHEAAPIAGLFTAAGLAGIVCRYRVHPHRHPAAYADAARAVRTVRALADRLGIDPSRVALMGFSAGGHLAATVATQPDLYVDPEDDLAPRWTARPDRAVLAYPVISMVHEYHAGSVANLLGPEASQEERRRMSNELHVTAANPPAFLFHTADDPAVPCSNSVRYAEACMAAGVPVELHVYASGPHGVGLAEEMPALRSWPGLLIDWLRDWIT